MKDAEQLQEEYVDALLDRITSVKYPSHELLQRAENLPMTREQAERLVDYMIGTIDGVQYPSHQMMDRVERILFEFPRR
jgi:hypothetical protein